MSETLQEREARLEAELAKVREEIEKARQSFTEGRLGTVLRREDLEISWNTDDRSSVFIDENCEDDDSIPVSVHSAALFAWVDRVRAEGETDL